MNSINEETPGVSGNSSEGSDQVGGQLVSDQVTEEIGLNSSSDWKNMSILERADYFLEQGWTIVPLHGILPDGTCSCGLRGEDLKNAGKHPTKSDWQNSCEGASKSKVHSWLDSKSKPMNIGLYAKPSGFFVVDVDPRSDGHISWIRMGDAAEGEIPDTVEAITGQYLVSDGRGGRSFKRGAHYYFKAKPGDYFIGNLKKQGYPGIDIKHHGYVVAPGSTHHSGVDYEWKPGHAPWEMEIAEAPEWLLGLIKKKYSGAGTGTGTGYRKVSSLGDEEWVEKWDAMRKQTVTETRYAKAALSRICAEIASLDDDRNNELNRAAFRVGQLVAGEQLMFAPSREALIAAAKKATGRNLRPRRPRLKASFVNTEEVLKMEQ